MLRLVSKDMAACHSLTELLLHVLSLWNLKSLLVEIVDAHISLKMSLLFSLLIKEKKDKQKLDG